MSEQRELKEREIKLKLEEKSAAIAAMICRGKDVEIRKSANGISIAEVSKRIVAK